MIEFRILGPLEVEDEGRLVPLGGTRQRAVLAILLLHHGEAVSVDRLVDELWGEQPPDTATKTVQVYVSRLRKELGQGVVLTRVAATCWISSQTSSTPSASSASRSRGATRWRAASRAGRASCLARRSTYGADRRWPTSRTSRSHRPISPASRSSGWSRSSTASRPTWRSETTQR